MVDEREAQKRAVTEGHSAAATAYAVPQYPLSEEEMQDGWDTLVNKCWLRCDNSGCKRWRNVPKAVRDKASRLATLHSLTHIYRSSRYPA
jgi:hypothetical protein